MCSAFRSLARAAAPLLLALASACATATVGAVSPRCGDSDDRSTTIAASLGAQLTGADGGAGVHVVSDDRTCRSALAAMQRATRSPERALGLYVFRIADDRYGVYEAVHGPQHTIEAVGQADAGAEIADEVVHLFDARWRPVGLAAM
ncbi:MAG TPA: hypothetical protein VHQ45_10430 [Gemmatimonadaceae bacterium]|nr:hypothetical protein [Gemmatimonadaceae bacterium]